jgi:transcriptional regulator with XRE-family HTH domain
VAEDPQRKAICCHVARILRQTRERRNLSLNELSSRAGLSRQMVSYVEKEERNPTLETLLRLTEVLEIKLEDVIKQARLAFAKTKGKPASR